MAPNLSALQTLVDERLLVATEQQQTTNTSDAQRIPSLLQRHGNVDTFYSASEGQDVALCHLFALFPFTDGDDPRAWSILRFQDGVAVVMLAMLHLNTGNGSIIPEIVESSSNCPIRFSLEIVDTKLRENIATEHSIQATNREFASDKEIHPCAFLGAARSAVSIPTSIISGLRGYPQISPISTSSALNDKVQFPLFARTIPSDDGTAVPLVLYFRDVLKLKYLAIIHINDTYGNAYAQGIQAAALEFAPDMVVQSVDIPFEATAEVIERAVNFLRETQYAFMFGILWRLKLFDEVLTEAHRQGIAGTGSHHWIFSEVTGNDIASRTFPRGSPLQKALLGSSVISASAGGEEFNPRLRLLTHAMREIKENPQNLEFIRENLPFSEFDVFSPDYLESPDIVGPFVYDAVVALGMSACQTWKSSININNLTSSNNDTKTSLLNGVDHFAFLVQTTFAGTSGNVILDSETGTRAAKSAFFQLNNYIIDKERSFDTSIQYKGVLIDLFSDGEWQKIADYVFNDGTTNIPPDISPNNVKSDTFSTGVRAGGLIMCGLAVMLALGFAAWTWKNRTHRVLAASQPIFLYLICTGVIVAVFAIVPLSIDEQVATVRGCSIACQSIPWLLSMGFSLIFSALFTKTWRINKIFAGGMQLRRVTLKPWDVAKPMFALMGANLAILTIWTVRAPLRWEYKVVREDVFLRPVELYGHCNSDGDLQYKISLACLNLMALIFALVAAYEARNISTQYAETEYIFLAIAVILIVCLLGVPVLALARENPDAYFFVFSGIIFTVCMSVLCLIFIPKVHFYRVACQEGSTKSAVFAAATSGYLRDWMAKGPESQLLPGSSVDDIIPLVDGNKNKAVEEEDSSQQKGLKILSKKTKRELILEVTMMRERLNKDLLLLEKSSSLSNHQFTSASNQMISQQLVGSSKVPSTSGVLYQTTRTEATQLPSSEAASLDKSREGIVSAHDVHSSSLVLDA